MSTEFRMPSEEEVRRAFNIPPGQAIRLEKSESLPDPSWLKKIGGFLEEAADFFGVPTFLLKAGGIIIAVIFVPYWGPKVKEEVKSAIVITRDYWVGPFQNLPRPTSDIIILILGGRTTVRLPLTRCRYLSFRSFGTERDIPIHGKYSLRNFPRISGNGFNTKSPAGLRTAKTTARVLAEVLPLTRLLHR